jgi:putative tricarboxylic transport membrane protein
MTPPPAEARSERTDHWTGRILVVVGFAFAFESWRMPRLAERGINPLTSPGIVPGALGVALLMLGLVLALRGPDPRRDRIGLETIIGTGSERRSLVIALGLNVIFALVLVGRAPFWLATFVYLVTFMSVFGLADTSPDAVGKHLRPRRAGLILLVASGTTAGIVYLFETLFFVRLP